jgi:hypothetical protein
MLSSSGRAGRMITSSIEQRDNLIENLTPYFTDRFSTFFHLPFLKGKFSFIPENPG